MIKLENIEGILAKLKQDHKKQRRQTRNEYLGVDWLLVWFKNMIWGK